MVIFTTNTGRRRVFIKGRPGRGPNGESSAKYSSMKPKSNVIVDTRNAVSVATPAAPRGEKKLFFVRILGGEKLSKFGEKCL